MTAVRCTPRVLLCVDSLTSICSCAPQLLVLIRWCWLCVVFCTPTKTINIFVCSPLHTFPASQHTVGTPYKHRTALHCTRTHTSAGTVVVASSEPDGRERQCSLGSTVVLATCRISTHCIYTQTHVVGGVGRDSHALHNASLVVCGVVLCSNTRASSGNEKHLNTLSTRYAHAMGGWVGGGGCRGC